jgi:outer membrane protein TolC
MLLVSPPFSMAGSDDPGTPQVLTLDEAIRTAMRQNPEILIALEEIRRNKGIVLETRAPALPQVSLSAVFTKVDPRLLDIDDATVTTGATTFLPISESYIVTGSLRQVLYSAAITPRLRAAKLQAEGAVLRLRETVNRVENQVRHEFYTALLNNGLLEVQMEASDLLLNQSRERAKRFEAGDITRFGVLQAKVACVEPVARSRSGTHHRASRAREAGSDARHSSRAARPAFSPIAAGGQPGNQRRKG